MTHSASPGVPLDAPVRRAYPAEDHVRALPACVDHQSKDWKRPQGRPRHTWLRTVEQHLDHTTSDCGQHYSQLSIEFNGGE